jgi:tripartite-type tricarboxylate transporter receptor subunit TctC
VSFALAVFAAQTALAQQNYPSKTITLIVPFAAGGTTDVIGRVIAEGMQVVLGQPVVVENRAGAGGSLGTAEIAKAAPDGYTIGMGTASTLAINPATYRNLPFDVLTDLAPIGNIAAVPNIMAINPTVKAGNIAELVALARNEPGKLSYASPGYGSVAHLLGEQFKTATGIQMQHIPYKGMGPALTDVLGGQVQVMFDNLPTSLEVVKSGRLRGLALSGARRVDALPDVPTFGEFGFTEMNWTGFFGLVAPKGPPAEIVKRLNEAMLRVLAMPKVRDLLAAQQAMIVGGSPEAFGATIRQEFGRMKRAAIAAKIELN